MGFRLEEAVPEDAPLLGEIMMQLSTSPRITLEFKDCRREDSLDWNVEGIQVELAACAKYPEEAIALKAVDEETGEIAGYAVWGWSERASDLLFQDKADIPLPSGSNAALRQTFVSRLQALEHTHRPSGQFYELCELNISPKFQRRGLGSQLVKYGLEKADGDEVMVYLSGSPMGVPVYRKLGFEEVGRLELDLSDFGGDGSHVHVAMIRKPAATVEC